MKLWLLRPINDDDWPNYDACYGFVVRAQTPEEARKIAAYSRECGDEMSAAWMNVNTTNCTVLGYSLDIRPGVVMYDFRAG